MNTLTPAIGSNQFLTKFGSKTKRKAKVKFATKVKLFLGLILVLSLFSNYYLLKTNYTLTCTAYIAGIKQNWNLGHLMSNNTCDELINDRLHNLAQ